MIVQLTSTLRKGRFEKSEIYLPQGAKISGLLDYLGISEDEVGALIVDKRDATFDQELKEDSFVTIIPLIGGG